MKFFISFLLTALLSFAAGLYLPWWSIAVAAFIVAVLVHQKAPKAFFAGFLGLFFLWGGLSFWIDIKNNSVLSSKIAQLLPLGGSSVLLIMVTALVGALVAALAAMTGSYLRASGKT